MCDLVTASLIATAAGSAMQAAGQAKAKRAMTGAQSAESLRQKGYRAEADAALGDSLSHASKDSNDNRTKDATAKREAETSAATAAAQAPVVTTGENLAGDSSGAKVVSDEVSRQSDRALGYAGNVGAAKAKLQGMGDVDLQNALFNIRAGQDQSRIANFALGSSNVLPIEMEAASHKGDGMKGFGDLLSAAGVVAGLGAGAGWGKSVIDGAPLTAAEKGVISDFGNSPLMAPRQVFKRAFDVPKYGGIDFSNLG